jgi:SlyX protein
MNDALSDNSSRLEALETRIAHQDQTIADLNDAITSQWRTIDAVQRHMQEMREELQNILFQRTTPEAAPPHY